MLAPLLGHPLRGLLPSVVGGYHEKWPIRASLRPLAIYIYVFGSQSCATRLIFAGSAPLAAAKQAAHGTLGSSARCSGARPLSRSLHRRSRRLHGDTRRNASSAGYASSPCDVSHRASDEPRRRMSLSSALATSSLASPSTRRVSFRSPCTRRLMVGSLNRAAYPPERSGVAEGELNAGCKSAAPPTTPPRSARRSPRPCRSPARPPASARQLHPPPSSVQQTPAVSAPQSSPPNPPRSKDPAQPRHS